MRLKFEKSKRLLLLTFISILPSPAFAWGLSTSLLGPTIETRLVYTVYRTQRIRYCAEVVDDWKVKKESIEHQTESGLRVWLEPLKSIGIENVKIEKAQCDAKDLDLKVIVGRMGGSRKNIAAGFYSAYFDSSRSYSHVIVDTEFTYANEDVKFTMVDFGNLYSIGYGELPKVLNEISFSAPTTTLQLAIDKQLEPQRVWHSTYNVIIHELGHAFGLCDTYIGTSDLIRQSNDCQAEFANKEHPDSVMKRGDRFSLAEDDRIGIIELFKRYKDKIKVGTK